MTKENVLKNYEKAIKDKDTVYAESLVASWVRSWPEVPFPKAEKTKKTK